MKPLGAATDKINWFTGRAACVVSDVLIRAYVICYRLLGVKRVGLELSTGDGEVLRDVPVCEQSPRSLELHCRSDFTCCLCLLRFNDRQII